ncbi:unnamed protein product [Schistosoma curassoni]|uniref:Uncharacterized protein n=1 Tax=Schistosoma curassoni TaxID=6186 RepID=A0A183JTC7_9TREM|nr:unnamed protein product [Schistosoma curassoni]
MNTHRIVSCLSMRNSAASPSYAYSHIHAFCS